VPLSDLRRRTLTAVVYGAVVLVAALAPFAVFVLAVLAMLAISLFELARLGRAGYAAAIELLVLILGAVSLLYLRVLGDSPGTPFYSRLGLGPLLMTIAAVWAADVGAYLIGSAVGRHRIAPRLSPGKTWEGTISSFVIAAAVVVVWNRPALGLAQWAIVAAVLVGPAAFAGDLLESWMKRRAGVKDSGTLLPGHGGMLDRIDSLVAAATVVAGAITYLAPLG
jgi:phosphatidate cytidylyltransferase